MPQHQHQLLLLQPNKRPVCSDVAGTTSNNYGRVAAALLLLSYVIVSTFFYLHPTAEFATATVLSYVRDHPLPLDLQQQQPQQQSRARPPWQNQQQQQQLQQQQILPQEPPFFPRPPGVPMRSGSYLPQWLLVGEVGKYAMTMVPKVMCSSIRRGFQAKNCRGSNGGGNGGNGGCAEARKNATLRTLPLRNFTTGIMIRDPFERAYSAYANSPYNRKILLDECRNENRTFQCTFEEWVDELADGGGGNGNSSRSGRGNAFMGNEHFKPQHAIAQMGAMHYHYRLRMSSEADRTFLWTSLLGLPEIVSNVEGDGGQGKVRTRAEKDVGGVVGGVGGFGANTTTAAAVVSASSSRERFFAIPRRTVDRLADLYREDLDLWQQFLDEGTPRRPGEEITMYDYYLERERTQQQQ